MKAFARAAPFGEMASYVSHIYTLSRDLRAQCHVACNVRTPVSCTRNASLPADLHVHIYKHVSCNRAHGATSARAHVGTSAHEATRVAMSALVGTRRVLIWERERQQVLVWERMLMR